MKSKAAGVAGSAAIQQPGDVGMLQISQNLSFSTQPGIHIHRHQTAPHQLDGHTLFKLMVDAFGEIHLTHAARADHVQQLIRPKLTTCPAG